MSRKKRYKRDSRVRLPSDIGGKDFRRQDKALNYRPEIQYEEPTHIPSEETQEDKEEPITEATQQTKDLIESYKAVKDLAETMQRRIDSRAKDLVINLDPQIDHAVISAIKRCFPETDQPTKISYEMYKQCLTRNLDTAEPAVLNADDIEEAKENPLRTEFGNLGESAGLGRTEIKDQQVEPLNVDKFVSTGVAALFLLLLPYIKKEDVKAIAKHLLTTPHT